MGSIASENNHKPPIGGFKYIPYLAHWGGRGGGAAPPPYLYIDLISGFYDGFHRDMYNIAAARAVDWEFG